MPEGTKPTRRATAATLSLPQPLAGDQAQGRLGDLLAADLRIQFLFSHDAPLL